MNIVMSMAFKNARGMSFVDIGRAEYCKVGEVWSICLLGPLHTRDWEPLTITLPTLSLVEKAEPVQVCLILCLRDQLSMWMQDGCKVHMDSYMASIGSCFMVTWLIFKNHFMEVGLPQNRETMALQMHTTVELLYFIICENPHEKNQQNSIWLRARSHTASHYTWEPMTTQHGCGGVLERPQNIFFWALTILWSRLLAHMWSGP